MKNLRDMYTLHEIDEFIDQIERNTRGLQQRASSQAWSKEDRAGDPKLDAMCAALEHRTQLESEIRSGIRAFDGTVNVRV